MASNNFYDEVTKKYGTYGVFDNNVVREYPKENPEDVFKRMLLDNNDTDRIALDLGCGDGRFTLSIASHFKKIFAIDTSRMLLAAALRLRKEEAIRNIIFKFQDAVSTTYTDNFFDIVYSRRGPNPLQEVRRVLKLEGFFIGIEIAELDCKEIKTIFGRGQNYEEWEGLSRKEKNAKIFKDLNFKVLCADEYFFMEYYPNYKNLETFLKKVPVFKDLDPNRDRKKLIEYVNNNTVNKGIRLERHKLVTMVQKL